MGAESQFELFADGLDHPEGVTWGPDGFVYAGGEAGQIWRVSLDGNVAKVADTGGGLLGVALDGDGFVYACDERRGEVVRINVSTGRVGTYSSGTTDRQMILPNYAAFDEWGNLYVTDSGDTKADNGLVFRIAPGGETTVWSEAPRSYPNGCCLSAGGDALYVAESYLPGVSRVPILPDGSAGEAEVVVRLPDKTVPDGLALDEEGILYISCYRPDRIYRVPPGEEPAILADDPEAAVLSAPTNMAFVGAALDRMVVANVGESHLTIADVGAVGIPLRYPSLS